MSDLNKKTCKELREIAKELCIVGRWEMSKQELIDAIQDQYDLTDDDITFENDCIIKGEDEIQPEGSQKVTKTTIDYLENAESGTLVAFKRNSKNVAMSGKLVSIENGKVFVESKNGTLFKLSIENIIWVKTGERWPKWVFNLFSSSNKTDKGVVDDNAVS